jgi:hypothetical protein
MDEFVPFFQARIEAAIRKANIPLLLNSMEREADEQSFPQVGLEFCRVSNFSRIVTTKA